MKQRPDQILKDKSMSNKTTIKPDPVLKDFWSDNNRFADLFNQVFFHGETVISPDKLSDKDTDESAIILEHERIAAVSRVRDVIKQHADGVELVLVALENQMKIHYAMPVRSMLYDALRYTRQCKKLEHTHRREGDLKEAGEFLSGMAKTDRLLPVINLVVYYGEKAWDGPSSLSDMMDIPPIFQPLYNDQRLNLLEARSTDGLQFEHEDNQDFFTLINEFYENDGHVDLGRLREKFSEKEIDWETMAALGAATGSGELIEYAQNHKGGRLNMCTALENLKQEGRQEGIEEGMIRGMITAYREQNVPETAILLKLQERFKLDYEKAQECLKQTE